MVCRMEERLITIVVNAPVNVQYYATLHPTRTQYELHILGNMNFQLTFSQDPLLECGVAMFKCSSQLRTADSLTM